MSRLADLLRAAADLLDPRPFFGDGDDEPTDRQWAGLIVLHAEAVHGCTHTADARAGIGMSGPAASSVPAATPVPGMTARSAEPGEPR